MRYFAFVFVLILNFLLIVLLGKHQPLGTPVPALGSFFSPFSGFWNNAAQDDGMQAALRQFKELTGSVDVVMDERLVPHIFAEHRLDAIFVQGYLAARYRLWQMDFATRAASGNLAAVLGERLLERDIAQRRKGMLLAAEEALAAWEKSPTEKAILEAYTHGVNAYISSLSPADYPLEFKLLGYAPERWTPLKSALMSKNMAETLCFSNEDLLATNAMTLWGKELFAFLYPEYNEKQSPIIPSGTPWNFNVVSVDHNPDSLGMIGELLPYELLPQAPAGIGSNNWAVSGTKTASGYPILCNDPHLSLSLPAIWYEIQIHAPDYQAYGVSIPGLPGIVIGFNDELAWGVTNVGQDVLDWYRISWLDDDKMTYLLDGQPQAVQLIEEVIAVRGRSAPHIEKVKHTFWGPVVYETSESPYRDLAMRWIAHEVVEEKPFYEIGAFLGLGVSKTHNDFTQALMHYESPAQNFVMASQSGDIAIRVNGKFPLKKNQQGRFVQDGSTTANAWAGYIPMDQIPQVLNPARGFVSSANQHSTDTSYPYYYNSANFDQYRGRIINRSLEQKQAITIQDMMDLQNDNRSIFAEEALPLLLKTVNRSSLNTAQRQYLKWLASWNLSFEANSKAPMVFVEWIKEVQQLTFDEIYTLKDSVPIMEVEHWRLLELLENHADHTVFDLKATSAVENAEAIVTQALHRVYDKWESKFADSAYDWGKHKSTDILHLARIPAFSRLDLPVGGYGQAPNAIKETSGPSWRVIVSLEPEVKAYGIYPGGQSGHPGSKFYDNSIEPWMKGQYNELYIMKNPLDKQKPVLFTAHFQGNSITSNHK
jgi:penicillin amidase